MSYESKIDITSPDKSGITPLGAACSTGNVKLVKLLLSSSKIKASPTEFEIACSMKFVPIVELLVANNPALQTKIPNELKNQITIAQEDRTITLNKE